MSNIIKNVNHQSAILLLSIFYIYFLSDLFAVISEGPKFNLVFRLCLPIWGKLGIELIKTLEKYNEELHEWWHQTMSTHLIIAYVFKFMHWVYDNGIHQCWSFSMEYGLYAIFAYIISKIFYNFIFYFNYSLIYLFFTLLCTYGVYMRFNTSKTAFSNIIGKDN